MYLRGRSVLDPVCGDWVDRHRNEIVFLHHPFAFCSRQCKERFLANPSRYLEASGERRGAPAGMSNVV